jgi:SAM-dependent methyltransferase
VADPQFRRDLFRGTARDYDRFRVPYPRELVDDLARRCGAAGDGSLLDLACGTGLISFALHDRFADVLAVDQEPDMIGVAREKVQAAGIGNIRLLTAAAEDLSVPDESFDLVAIGNAFHRLPRDAVAARVWSWLRPGGWLALVWGGSPWDGEQPWQRVVWTVMERWQTRGRARDRVPAGHELARSQRPDLAVLADSGFCLTGRYEFSVAWEWTPEALVGFMFSTSILSRAALGDLAAGFEDDLRRELSACATAGRLAQRITFTYELAQRPA